MFPRSVPYENSPPERSNIVTVGMPGVTSTRSQMARYTGGDAVTVLRNWADDPHGPLHKLEKDSNRFTGMSFGRRVSRMVRLWNTVVFGCKGEAVDAAEDTEEEAKRKGRGSSSSAVVESYGAAAAATDPALGSGPRQQDSISLNRRSKHASSPHPSFSDEPSSPLRATLDPVVEAADKGLVDPPVLYRATCRVAPRLLHGVMPSPEVSESRHRHWYCTLNPLHWMLLVKELITGWWFCTRPFQFCYSEPGRTNMGGLRDQAAYTREVHRAIHKIESDASSLQQKQEHDAPPPAPHKVKHLVLFGVSRGATTCFYSAMKLSANDAKHVSLVLVEAPFDTLEHVIDASSPVPQLLRWFFRAFCDWRGSRDEAAAYDFNPREVHLRCPVAFVMSTKDRRVPNECTQALIDRVRRELVPHVIPAVEVLTLQHSRHPCMAVGHKEDQDAYVAFVEDLYNRYCPP
ncbi:hypothetical protein N2W54_000393 [Lotmaria passim]